MIQLTLIYSLINSESWKKIFSGLLVHAVFTICESVTDFTDKYS